LGETEKKRVSRDIYGYVGGYDLVAGKGLRVMTSKIQRATRLFKMNIIGIRQISGDDVGR
jgi:hypothetical protein